MAKTKVEENPVEESPVEGAKEKATARLIARRAQAAERAAENQKNVTPFVDLNRGDSLA